MEVVIKTEADITTQRDMEATNLEVATIVVRPTEAAQAAVAIIKTHQAIDMVAATTVEMLSLSNREETMVKEAAPAATEEETTGALQVSRHISQTTISEMKIRREVVSKREETKSLPAILTAAAARDLKVQEDQSTHPPTGQLIPATGLPPPEPTMRPVTHLRGSATKRREKLLNRSETKIDRMREARHPTLTLGHHPQLPVCLLMRRKHQSKRLRLQLWSPLPCKLLPMQDSKLSHNIRQENSTWQALHHQLTLLARR